MTSERAPSDTKPLRRDARANLARILEAASALLVERGPGVPMDAIAERAGVGIGTLYRRFPTRQLLLAAVAEQAVGHLARAAQDAAVAPPWEGLTGFLSHAVVSPVADPALRRLLIGESPPDLAEERWRDTLVPAYQALVEHAREAGVARDDLAPTDLPLVVMAVAAVARQTGGMNSAAARRIFAIVTAGLQPNTAGPLSAPAVDEQHFTEMLLRPATEPQRVVHSL